MPVVKISDCSNYFGRIAYLAACGYPKDLVEGSYRKAILPNLGKIDMDYIINMLFDYERKVLQREKASINEYLKHLPQIEEPLLIYDKKDGKEHVFTWVKLSEVANEVKNAFVDYLKENYSFKDINRLKLSSKRTKNNEIMADISSYSYQRIMTFGVLPERTYSSYSMIVALITKWLILENILRGDKNTIQAFNKATRIICEIVSEMVDVDYKELWDIINKAMNTSYSLDF
ncbi:hypothetical protein [Hydrogenobaculum acidophilum]